jgi:hypothetical protein
MSNTPPPYQGPPEIQSDRYTEPTEYVTLEATLGTIDYTAPGLAPAVRVLRTLLQSLAVIALALPAGIIAANTMAEQADLAWRVPPSAWIAASIGAGLVPIVSALQNMLDAKKDKRQTIEGSSGPAALS